MHDFIQKLNQNIHEKYNMHIILSSDGQIIRFY
jgi:hypothetical protein